MLRKGGMLVAVLAALWGLWEGAKWLGEATAVKIGTLEINDVTMPHLHDIVGQLFEPSRRNGPLLIGVLLDAAWFTAKEAAAGFLLGAAVGFALGIVLAHSRLLQRGFLPYIVASQTIPILAIAPIVIVVLGSIGITGLFPKSIISAYLCFFPVTIGMVKGLTSPDVMQRDLMRTYSASQGQTFWKLRLPASLTYLFAGLKVAVAISLIGAIVGELPTGAQAGLGARLLAGSYYGQTIQIWAALFGAAILASTLVAAVSLAERVLNRSMGARPA